MKWKNIDEMEKMRKIRGVKTEYRWTRLIFPVQYIYFVFAFLLIVSENSF